MAAKRFHDDESGSDPDHQPTDNKRIRTTARPSFASVIGEALMVNSLQKFCLALEPMLRRVVNEEVESSLRRCSSRNFTRSPSLRIQAPEASPSTLQLIFRKKLMLPIFTGSKIMDTDAGSLQIYLVEKHGERMDPVHLPYPIRIEIVVLDSDFPSEDKSSWTSQEFDNNILKERTGKRPLLAGDCLTVTLRDSTAVIGEIEFTDNSSWIRSRKFRLGARVVQGTSHGIRIREAMTEAFVVKDHRGELYKKHHPPMLEDEVWRLEKIGKDGAFHKKLSAHNINTVQDFLKLSIVDLPKLRTILGPGMSEKIWEVTMKHARTCVLGNKHYIFHHGQNCTITLNPICQVVNAVIDGTTLSTGDLPNINRAYIANLARQAYASWNSLQEIPSELPLITQGEQGVEEYPSHHLHQGMVKQQPIYQIEYSSNNSDHKYIEIGNTSNGGNMMGYSNWHQAASITPTIGYSISESSSEGELTPRSYIHRN